jgi:hypothetical protein
MNWPKKGTKVEVFDGGNNHRLGVGTFLGLCDVWVAITPEGDLLSCRDARRKPGKSELTKNCEWVKFSDNPKIRLDEEGRVVYGCQVFWKPVKVEETVVTAKQRDKVREFADTHEQKLKRREKQRDIWLVWATMDVRGREVTDLRAVEETSTGADFVKEILERDEPGVEVFVEKRVTHHIYGHRDIEVARRFARMSR